MTFWDKFMNWLGSVFTIPKSSAPPIVTETPNEAILRIARAELGEKEILGSAHNPRILEYHTKATATGRFKADEIPWCASFICWVLDKAGLAHTNNALAISYAKWGTKVNDLKSALPGDIIVRSRGKGLNHVHILDAPYTTGDTYKGIGGNQSNAVTTSSYSVSGIKHIRRAVGAPVVPPPPPIGNDKTMFPQADWAAHALKMVKSSRLLSAKVSDAWFVNTPQNWVHLLAAMCHYESGFRPGTTYKESFKYGKGEIVISTGLFQLSYESVGGYGFKVTTEDLKKPLLNIEIAVKILERWVVSDGVIAGTGRSPYKGGSKYWSTLRASGKLEAVKALYGQWAK